MHKKPFLFLILGLIVPDQNILAQTYRERFDSCSKPLEKPISDDSIYTERILERDACMIGAEAPQFAAVTIGGARYDSLAFAGRVVVLHFWSTTCGPCIEEIPWLNEVLHLYRDSAVTFLSFAPEPVEKLTVFLKKHHFMFPVVAQGSRIASDLFGLTAFFTLHNHSK